jgi:glucose/arabinose dehydrogenase
MRSINVLRNLFLWVYIFLLAPAISYAAVPTGFTLTQVAGQLNFPTQLAWLPDGSILITEKPGVVKILRNGALQVVADLRSSTNDYWDRGLLGIAVDPDFANNHFVYLNRVFEKDPSQYTGPKTSQLLRITLDAASAQMVPGSLVVLLGSATPTSCKDLAATADCIPADSETHSVGDVIFAPDGTLFASYGDGSEFQFNDTASLRAQDLNTFSGKVVHIDRNGRGVPGNPFYTGNPADNRSKIYAYGMRNPWRLTVNPATGAVYIADVGSDYFEELDVAGPGANFGWPCYEGEKQRNLYEFQSVCGPLYNNVNQGKATVTAPLTGWLHNGGGAAIVGGAFAWSASYPDSLRGSFVYGDYVNQTLSTLRVDGQDKLAGLPQIFADALVGTVSLRAGPGGKLYLVQIADESNNPGTGSIQRLDYQTVDPGGACPDGQFKADYFVGDVPTGTPALSACEGPLLDHHWGFASPGPGVPIDHFSARWSGDFNFVAGNYQFDTTADDGVRIFLDGAQIIDGWRDQAETHYQAKVPVAAGKHNVRIEYYDSGEDATLVANWTLLGAGNNAPPVVTIAAPLDNSLYAPGATVTLNGSATDAQDGALPAASLQWNIVIQHCSDTGCHTHFLQQIPGATGSFIYPDHGTDPYYVEATLIATDSAGAQTSRTVRLNPNRGTATCPATQFRGDYFNNKTLDGVPVATLCYDKININLPTGSPAPTVNADNFSARFTRTLDFAGGTIRFVVVGDDGVRLFVDDVLVIDGWVNQAATTYQKDVVLTAGSHTLRLEFYDALEDAVVRLDWLKR